MKRIIALAAVLAALALAGCEKEETISEETQHCIDLMTGSFHGEYTWSSNIGYRSVPVLYQEDITYTPFNTPQKVSGEINKTVHGKASITSYTACDSTQFVYDPVSFVCYYTVKYDEEAFAPLCVNYYEYDKSTGLTNGNTKECYGHIIDDESFSLNSYHWPLDSTYTRQ